MSTKVEAAGQRSNAAYELELNALGSIIDIPARGSSGLTVKVGFDGRYFARGRGIGNASMNLLNAMLAQPECPELVVYTRRGAFRHDEAERSITIRQLGPSSYPLWEHFALPRAMPADSIDVLHCVGNTAPAYLPSRVQLVLTVHDSMFMLPTSELPRPSSAYQFVGRLYRRTVVPLAVRSAAMIITVSEHSKSDLIRHLGIAPDRIVVIPEAPGAEFRRLPEDRLHKLLPPELRCRQPLVVALAAIDRRKNTTRILAAFARMIRQGYEHHLALIGVDKSMQSTLSLQLTQMGLSSRVHLLGFLPRMSLVAAYNAACMFVYPSLYEGFGLPVLEAMACGVPVITSTTTALPEVAGGAALLVDPTDVGAISQAMESLASDPALCERKVQAGSRRVSAYSWSTAALETIGIYRTVHAK